MIRLFLWGVILSLVLALDPAHAQRAEPAESWTTTHRLTVEMNIRLQTGPLDHTIVFPRREAWLGGHMLLTSLNDRIMRADIRWTEWDQGYQDSHNGNEIRAAIRDWRREFPWWGDFNVVDAGFITPGAYRCQLVIIAQATRVIRYTYDPRDQFELCYTWGTQEQ